MRKNARNFDWNHIRAFLAVINEGSLSGAARALGQTQPTLSRQISNLEMALQVSLFVRGGREAQLTESGAALLEQVQNMAEAADQISLIATGRNRTIEGTIRIAATEAMVAYVLPHCLKSLRYSYPDVRVELIASSALSDLSRSEADIAIRHVRPEQPDLIAKKVCDFDISLFASPDYLASIGENITLQDIAHADFIGFEHPERLVPGINDMGVPVTIDNFRVTASTGLVMYELAKSGLGIALLPTLVAQNNMGLRRVHPNLGAKQLPIWLVSHKDVKTNLRIRLCFDHISDALLKLRDP